MSDTLLIHYNPADPQQASWSLCNNEGELTCPVQQSALAELGEQAQQHRTVVLLHSQCLHINTINLPAMNMQKTMRAVPYAVEEFIAGDVDEFHFVAATDKSIKGTAVIGIERGILQNIIDIFRSHHIFIDTMLADVLCINGDETQWSCLRFQDDVYIQTSRYQGIVTGTDLGSFVINSKLGKQAQDTEADVEQALPEKLLVFSEQDDNTALPEIDNEQLDVVDVRYNQHPLVVFCGNYKLAEPLNLLQHKFRQKRESTGYLQHWRLAASLAAAWLVLSLAISGYKLNTITSENEQLGKQIDQVYKQTFPGSRLVAGQARKLMQDKFEAMQNGAGSESDSMLFLLTEAFGSLRSDPANITLRTLTYRNSKIEIGLDGSTLEAIQNLNNKLNESNGIRAEITSSSSEKDRVRGNIRIESRTGGNS